MGKGLGIQPKGVHIAFAAGTGVLVFVDLVAHLIRKNRNALSSEEDSQLTEGFKFVFYVSFANQKEAIGLELLEGLVKINEERGIHNFELVKRFSDQRSERWERNYIKK